MEGTVDMKDMTKKERKEYFEKLGIDPKKVEEYETGESGVPVHGDERKEEDEEREERRKEELERYRERTGF